MQDWAHVEVHYNNVDKDGTYYDMCANAIPWEFCFCVLPSELVKAKGKCVVILSPIAYFQKFKHIPNCPIFIDDILPNLTPSLDIENEWYSSQSIDDVRHTMTRLGFVESKELEGFFLDIYTQIVP
jgi:hypothetical protein